MRLINPWKTRLVAGTVVAASMFLPLSTCTQNGKTTTFVPFRDAELLPVLLVYALPLLLAIGDAFARPFWVRVTLLSLEPIAAGFSGYVVWMQAVLRTPIWGFYVVTSGLVLFFLTALAGLVHTLMQRRAARLQSTTLQPIV